MWYIGIYFLHKYLHPIYFKNAHISQLLDFIAIQQLHGSAGKTGDEQKRKQRVLGVHTAKTAGVSTAAHFARKARTTIFERTFAPQSLFLSANAGRGTTERGTRHDRTWDETQSNAGRDAIERGRAFADKYRDYDENMLIRNTKHGARNDVPPDL